MRPPRLDLVTGTQERPTKRLDLHLTLAEHEVVTAWLRSLATPGEARQLARVLRRVVVDLSRGRK